MIKILDLINKTFNTTLISSIDVIKQLHMKIMGYYRFWDSKILQHSSLLVTSPVLS